MKIRKLRHIIEVIQGLILNGYPLDDKKDMSLLYKQVCELKELIEEHNPNIRKVVTK